jgi:hypothetical protein
MQFLSLLSAKRPDQAPGAYCGRGQPAAVWPRGGTRLIVVISDVDARGELIVAHGFDPDRPSGEGNVVFAAELARRDLGQLIRTVVAAAIADRDAEASLA